jgi:hypothetical protein
VIPDFFVAFRAATAAIADGDVDEAEIVFDACKGDWMTTLTVSVRRRYIDESESTEIEESTE